MTAFQRLQAFRDAQVRAKKLEAGVIEDDALKHQAEQVDHIVRRLADNDVVLLRDRTGAGKTVVSVTAAGLAAQATKPCRIAFVAPNSEVRQRWEDTYQCLWGPKGPAKHVTVGFATHRTLNALGFKPHLLVIDEAHRGLQSPGAQHHALAELALEARVLLVTATPFQLSTEGLIRMLSLPGGETTEFPGAVPIRHYGRSVQGVLHAWRRAKGDAEDDRVRDAAGHAREAHRPASEQLDAVSPMPMGDVTAPRPPTPLEVPATDDWLTAYHAARVVPELLGDAHPGDMFRRRLTSSSEAFWQGAVGRQLTAAAKKSPQAKVFADRLRERLGEGEAHAKVGASVTWIAEQVKAKRHVLVFCVFKETQQAIAAALKARKIDHLAPDDRAALNKSEAALARFRKPPGRTNRPLVIVGRDNLSESIDLDGGRASLLHHDLAWNPARLTQRWGRLVRRSSNFVPVPDEHHQCPLLPVEFDQRMAEVVLKRRSQADVMVPGEALQGDDADEQIPWHHLLADPPPPAATSRGPT